MKAYRVSDVRTTDGVRVYVEEFDVLRETPKGVWVGFGSSFTDSSCRRFVRQDARKKFACLTLDEAKESFLSRKNKQIKILNSQLDQAKRAKEKVHEAIKLYTRSSGLEKLT